MGQLVLLVVPVLQGDEDAQIVCSSDDAHARAGELGAELVIASCADAFLRAVDVEGGDGRVVGGLFGEVRDGDGLVVASDAVGAARGCRGGRLERAVAVFDLPVTLQESVTVGRGCRIARTLKNSPSVEL